MWIGGINKVLRRTLTVYENTQPIPPWNYKKYGYKWINSLIDKSAKRINENSKVVIVCGNIGIGKAQFSEKLAKKFNLCYFEDVNHDEDGFKLPNGLDLRQFDEQLPHHLQTYALKDWFTDMNPGIKASKIQMNLYDLRFRQYANALAHLFNTGQGVLLERSIWTDKTVAHALHSCGLISSDAIKYYNLISDQTLCSMLHPHLTIFLDCSPECALEFARKNRPEVEAGSPLLSLELFQRIHTNYLETTLPLMEKYGQVMKVDWVDFLEQEDMDFEIKMVASDVMKIDLDSFDNSDLHKFRDWRNMDEGLLKANRLLYTDPNFTRLSLIKEIPWDCEELRPNEYDYDLWYNVISMHPQFWRSKKYLEYPTGLKSFFRWEM